MRAKRAGFFENSMLLRGGCLRKSEDLAKLREPPPPSPPAAATLDLHKGGGFLKELWIVVETTF